MKRLAAVLLVALVSAGAASAGQLPSPAAPNATTVMLPQLVSPLVAPQQLSFQQLQPIWQAAGQAYGVPWSVLAAINKIESNFGQNMGPSSAGAIGWMQFMPDTWARWGVDANGDGIADPWNAEDAIYSAARYLAATGAATDLSSAVFSYNHAQWYVDEVLQLAQNYDSGGADFSAALNGAQQQLDTAKQALVDANQRLLDATAVVSQLQAQEDQLLTAEQNADSFATRVLTQRAAVLLEIRLQSAQADADARRADVETAQASLASARDSSTGTAFASGAGTLLESPTYSDGYVFPVAGGAGVVTVGLTHHDYPAANIDAPEGTQLYALSDGTVDLAWLTPDAKCGIGFTITTVDGLTWTYCHMSYLEPSVATGATLTAGQPVGLVGQTGDATGPNLHLQLQPATGYPQDEPWFQSFAGTAFSWSTDVQHNAAPQVVFAVVGVGDPTAPRSLDSASTTGIVYFSASGA